MNFLKNLVLSVVLFVLFVVALNIGFERDDRAEEIKTESWKAEGYPIGE